ncbi:hypothetical protein ES703_65197 [subsurface metagenome]
MGQEKSSYKLVDWNEDAKELLTNIEQRLKMQPRKELRDWLEEQKRVLTYSNEIEFIGHMLKMDSEGMIDVSLIILKSAVENAD